MSTGFPKLINDRPEGTPHTLFFLPRNHKKMLRVVKSWQSQGFSTAIASLRGDQPPNLSRYGLENVPTYLITDGGNEVFKSFRLDTAWRIKRLIEDLQPNLLFSYETLVDYHVKMALLGKSIPLVTMLGIHRWSWDKKKYRIKLFQWLSNKSAGLVANAYLCLEGYRHIIGNERFEKIPSGVILNPVVPDEFEPVYERNNGDLFVIGGLGRLHYQNGFDLLIEAFSMLPDHVDGKRPILKLKGPSYHGERLKNLIEKYQVDDRVEILPRDPHVDPFLKTLDCLVAPSRYAGFDNVPLESILSGTLTLPSAETGFYQLPNHLRFPISRCVRAK